VRWRWREGALFLAGVVALLTPLRLCAQLANVEVPRERTVPLEQEVSREVSGARWKLGPVSLLPRLSLNSVGYDSNLFGSSEGAVSDWTADMSAGLRLGTRLGRKAYLLADAIPEYTWYAHHADGRFVGGRYGASLLGFFNRMSVQMEGYLVRTVASLSSEQEAPVASDTRGATARAEVDLSAVWSIFGGAEAQRVHYLPTSTLAPVQAGLQALDRNEQAARGGLRFRASRFLDVALVAEGTWSRFSRSEADRDNRTTAYLGQIHYDREWLFVNVTGGYRAAHPWNGSGFAEFRSANYSYFVSYAPGRVLEFQLYGHRGPVYSLFGDSAYYLETRNGAGLNVKVGRRLKANAFFEYGTNRYPRSTSEPNATAPRRSDTATTVGSGLTVTLTRQIAVGAMITRTLYGSNFPGLDRSITRAVTNVSFGGNWLQ
jgi:hypothetical protein